MWRKLLFFGVLYFVQGAALAYVVNFQKPYLSAQGVSKETLGVFTSLLLLPFILKVVLGYISDRFPLGGWGARKPYMVGGLLLFAACYFSLAYIQPGQNFLLFAAITWLASLGLAWFDTCADGWAVDSAQESEQSAVQAAMIGGKSFGLVTMSAVFGLFGLRFGFQAIFILLGIVSSCVLLVVLLATYKPLHIKRVEFIRSPKDFLQAFYLFFALYAIIYSIGSFGTDGLLTLFLSEARDAGTLQLGFFGMWRGSGALIGAIVFALLTSRIGLPKSQKIALVLLGAGSFLPLTQLSMTPLAVVWGIVWGFQETAFVTVAMRMAQGRWAATLFAGAMIFSNLGTSVGEGLGAPLVPSIGFEGVFTMFAVFGWASLLFVGRVLKLLAPVAAKAD